MKKAVLNGYKATEDAAVSGFNKVSDKIIETFLPKIMKRLKKLKLVYLPQLVQKILPYLRVMKNKQSTMIEIKFTSKNEL